MMSQLQKPSVNVSNIQPKDSLTLTGTILAGTNVINTNYQKSFNFYNTDLNIISNVQAIIDTAGIYNVTTPEDIDVGGTLTVTIGPGYYDPITLFNELSISTPLVGYKAFYSRTTTNTVTFPPNSTVAIITGFATKFQPTSLTIPIDTIAPNISDFTYGFDIMNISCSLINPANAFGENYLASFLIAPDIIGRKINVSRDLHKPVIQTNVANLLFEIYDANNNPYIMQADVTIIVVVDVYDK